MKIIYLAAGYAVIPGYDIVYNDYYVDRDLKADMLQVDLSSYDILIASPPCNYYSKANYRRNFSDYALNTRHLLPCILDKFIKTGKPFIIENVINKPLMFNILSSLPFNIYYFEWGRHCYFTNIYFDFNVSLTEKLKIAHMSPIKRQGYGNVNQVFKRFLEVLYV